MPAIMAHDFFGQDAYKLCADLIGADEQQYFAFLLGNQGPDPLFYACVNPVIAPHTQLGSIMHHEKTNQLLTDFHDALGTLSADELPVGRAYLYGFLCHYLLDSTMHPLVYANQFAFCDAGIEGLTRADGNEVHAVIESTFDEMVLYRRTGQTVATFAPEKEILRASDETLNIIGKLYSYMAVMTYTQAVDTSMFRLAVKSFRFTQGVFHSPTGIKRDAIAWLEELARPYSFYRSMAHRAIEITECEFDNHQHAPWKNPFTQEQTTASFDDLFGAALSRVAETLELFSQSDFCEADADYISRGGLNFSGDSEPNRE